MTTPLLLRSVLAGGLVLAVATSAFADTVESGVLRISDARISFKDTSIDLYMSIRNTGGTDEKLGGAQSPWRNTGIVEVVRDDSGTEHESPLAEPIPAKSTVEFSPTTKWLRLRGVQTQPKAADLVPITLYFRYSPNAVLHAALDSDMATDTTTPTDLAPASAPAPRKGFWAAIVDWFKK